MDFLSRLLHLATVWGGSNALATSVRKQTWSTMGNAHDVLFVCRIKYHAVDTNSNFPGSLGLQLEETWGDSRIQWGSLPLNPYGQVSKFSIGRNYIKNKKISQRPI